MKKIFLLAAFAALTTGVQAQDARRISKEDRMEKHQKLTPDERADRQAKMMQKRLGLSDEQTHKIREANLKYMPEKDLERERREMRKDHVTMLKNREEAYQQILTREQMDDFRKLKEDRLEHAKEIRAERKKARTGVMEPASR